MRVIRGGFECRLQPESVIELGRGRAALREVRDYDGMPVVVRVWLDERGLHLEAWGVRSGRQDEERAREWERLSNGGGGGKVRGDPVASILRLPRGREKGRKDGRANFR